jgi:FkbM family methyltransferase
MRHRIVAWISQNFFDNVTYTVRHGLLAGMKRRGGLAWLPAVLLGTARTAEVDFWRKQDLDGLVIYDVGAFQGLLTLFFAQHARQVVSYEPNTRNHERLVENLASNGLRNVVVRKVGVGSRRDVAMMVTPVLMPGGASVERETVAGLLSSKQPVVSEQISLTTLDDDIREMRLPSPDFIKIDVEGGELAALEGARNTLLTHKPRLFLEMHGETMNLKRRNVADIVTCLFGLGYADILHVESGAKISSANSITAVEGHLYCQ